MSGFLTGVLNISLMVVLTLSVLIHRGQHHAAKAEAFSDPAQILSTPEPEQLRPTVPELELPDMQVDIEQMGTFVESWLRRLSIELYSAVTSEQQLEGQRLRSNLDTEILVQPNPQRKIMVDPALMTPIRIPADKEPVAVSSF